MTEIQTTAVIHYQSPESDPLKVPRPTRITADATGELITTGGEGEVRGDKLIGLSRVDGPPPTFDPEDWVDARDILDADPTEAVEWAGWFPTFLAPESGIYTWSGAVDRVEVILGAAECPECHAEVWVHKMDCSRRAEIHPMGEWVNVVAADDETTIWSGPSDMSEAWLASDQARQFDRALGHLGTHLTRGETFQVRDTRYLIPEVARVKYAAENHLPLESVPAFPEGTREYADYAAKLKDALAGPEMEAWAKDLLMTDPNKIGR